MMSSLLVGWINLDIGKFILIVLVGLLSLLYLALRRCGPQGVRPTGWSQNLAPYSVYKRHGLDLEIRKLQWEERFEAAKLISQAHAYTGSWVNILEDIAPVSKDVKNSVYYSYTLADQNRQTEHEMNEKDKHSVSKRIEAITWFISRNLSMLSNNEHIYVIIDKQTKSICGFAMLVNSVVDTHSIFDMLRVGLLSVPYVFGFKTLKRLLAVMDEFDTSEHSVLQQYYIGYKRYKRIHKTDKSNKTVELQTTLRLERVAVAPYLQGQGIGRWLMQTVGQVIQSSQHDSLLVTQNERTVIWYESFGWKLVRSETLGLNSSFPFKNWTLMHARAKDE